MLQCLQVGHQSLQDSFLFGLVGNRDFDRAIQPQFFVEDFLQRVVGTSQHEVGGQHGRAELKTGLVDRDCRRDFLFPGEQGNSAHLHQVHADRIVDGIFRQFSLSPDWVDSTRVDLGGRVATCDLVFCFALAMGFLSGVCSRGLFPPKADAMPKRSRRQEICRNYRKNAFFGSGRRELVGPFVAKTTTSTWPECFMLRKKNVVKPPVLDSTNWILSNEA